MTAAPFIIALAVVTLLFFVLANLRRTSDVLSAGVLLRFYLYIASFVTLVICVVGLIYMLTGLFSLESIKFSYAGIPSLPESAPRAPATTAATPATAENQARQQQQSVERQRDEQSTDLLRGGTLAVIGGLLFGIHVLLRRRGPAQESAEGNFRRGFLVVGLVTFGLVGLVALPVGIYQTLKFFLIAPLPTQTQVAPGNTLATGILLTPIWIVYLLALTRQARAAASEKTAS